MVNYYQLFLLPLWLGVLPLISQASTNFTQCLIDVRKGDFGPIGLDFGGNPVNASDADAISYPHCVQYCGAGQEPMQWTVFFQQFSSLLLPWLALVSQLPFGANNKLVNLEAMLLTVGSPMLAAYSLVLTVLNGRWIARRFHEYQYPNVANAIRVLSSLQQSPLRITSDDDEALLASLIVLPQNDKWWEKLVEYLDYSTYSWSISAAFTIIWVVVAYIFAVVDSFGSGDALQAISSNGLSVGSLWLWLVPIVVGWLQISPKCDSIRVRKAIDKANAKAYVAQNEGDPVLAASVSDARAIYLDLGSHDSLRVDEQSTPPVYNYARFFSWVEAVEVISDAYREASRKAQRHEPVSQDNKWVGTEWEKDLCTKNRVGGTFEVVQYCAASFNSETEDARSIWGPHTFLRMLIASGIAIMLQWGATSAAVIVAWFTPTAGLGCRSVSYIAHGVYSTMAWMLLVTSSILSHYSLTFRQFRGRRWRATRFLAILLRREGKFIASLNAIWIVISCMFQFTNFFDRCYCNSSSFSLGGRAYDVILPVAGGLSNTWVAWSGSVGLAGGSALIFILFVNLFIDPTLPE